VRARRDGRQAFQEFVRRKNQVPRAVVPGARERTDDAAVGEAREPFLRQRRAQEVAAQPFEPGPIVGGNGAIGMEIEALEVRMAAPDGRDPGRIRVPADAQDGRAGPFPEGRSPTDGGRGQLREHGRGVGEGIGREVGRLVGSEHTPAPQQAKDTGADGRK